MDRLAFAGLLAALVCCALSASSDEFSYTPLDDFEDVSAW